MHSLQWPAPDTDYRLDLQSVTGQVADCKLNTWYINVIVQHCVEQHAARNSSTKGLGVRMKQKWMEHACA